MVRIAPRYDAKIMELLCELDDPTQPIAEICRRVAHEAQQLGLTRPSPGHLRALLGDLRAASERERRAREERRAIRREVLADWVLQVSSNAYEDEIRIEKARRRRESK